MARSPPKNLPSIPGVTSPLAGKENKPIVNSDTTTTLATSAEEKPMPTDSISTAGDYFLFYSY